MNGVSPRATRNALWTTVLVVAILYFAREFFIPIALSILISFLLAPLLRRFERWGLGRVAAVLSATFVTFLVIAALGYIIGGQLIDLARDLPNYKSNLHAKVVALRAPKDGAIGRATQTLQEITTDITSPEPQSTAGSDDRRPLKELAPAAQSTPPGSSPAPAPTPEENAAPSVQKPVPVSVVYTPSNAVEALTGFVSPILAPLGTAAIVVVFVIFMLLEREDLRDRIIHLIGRGHLQITTQALDEVANRVSRYLLAQLIVNVTYGFPIGLGLYFIGVPNAVLWGLMATLFRFVPYIGPWIAAAFPISLALAVSPGWTMPVEAIGLFVVLELISNNVVEPWLYGSSTGMSPMAVIVSAAFWTWLWGPIGLLLATPLTVCIAVIGKYIPTLSFLDVLLGDRPPIAAEDRFYQRLLAMDEEEVGTIAEAYVEKHTLAESFENLIIPALWLADVDYHNGVLNDETRAKLFQIVRGLVEDLGEGVCDPPAPPRAGVPTEEIDAAVICVPASDEADEIIACMLAKLLVPTGITARVLSAKSLASEMMEQISSSTTRQICVSVLPPGSTRQAVYMCKRLRERFPEARIVVGLWNEPEGEDSRIKRIRRVQVDSVVTTLQQGVKEIVPSHVPSGAHEAAAG